MSKKLFATGDDAVTALLCDYLSSRMDAEFVPLQEAEIVILLHEIGKETQQKTEEGLQLTKSIIHTLLQADSKATVVYFAPRRIAPDDALLRSLKMQGEALLEEYANLSKAKVISYKLPRLFGPAFDSKVIDRLITTGKAENSAAPCEFLHSLDLMKELYRMINGVPAFTGFGNYAYPSGAYHTTEGAILKTVNSFKAAESFEVPDFPSAFERRLYDYYLHKKKCSTYKIEGPVVLSSRRFGTLGVTRLAPGHSTCVTLDDVSGVRMLVLCGTVRTDSGAVCCADDGIIRLDLCNNTIVENIGSDTAVIEVWSHTIS